MQLICYFKKIKELIFLVVFEEEKTIDFSKYKKTIKFKENADQNPEKLVFKYNDARMKTTEKTFEFELVD